MYRRINSSLTLSAGQQEQLDALVTTTARLKHDFPGPIWWRIGTAHRCKWPTH
jgi:hypothetical protein